MEPFLYRQPHGETQRVQPRPVSVREWRQAPWGLWRGGAHPHAENPPNLSDDSWDCTDRAAAGHRNRPNRDWDHGS